MGPPRDALVSRAGKKLADLPEWARIGTSSLRRSVQLRALRPDLQIVPVRGNVQTRLSRTLGSGADPLDAVVLALAGLKRLGLDQHVTEALDPAQCVPAVGQGILGVQYREGDERVGALLEPFAHAPTEVAAQAERALLKGLGAGCTVPLGGHATVEGDRVKLTAVLGDPDTLHLYRVQREGSSSSAERFGREAALELLAGEGGRLLERLSAASTALSTGLSAGLSSGLSTDDAKG